MKSFVSVINEVVHWIYPQCCFACRDLIHRDEVLCGPCRQAWVSFPEDHCPSCLKIYQKGSGHHGCLDCLSGKNIHDQVYCLGVYEGTLHRLVLQYKYHGQEQTRDFFKKQFRHVFPWSLLENDYDYVIPVPVFRGKLRKRFFNPCLWVARDLSKMKNIPLRKKMVVKIRDSIPQTELSGQQRRNNLHDCFQSPDAGLITGKKILLVDDVYTTGTTVNRVTSLLKKKGALQVDVFVLARAV